MLYSPHGTSISRLAGSNSFYRRPCVRAAHGNPRTMQALDGRAVRLPIRVHDALSRNPDTALRDERRIDASRDGGFARSSYGKPHALHRAGGRIRRVYGTNGICPGKPGRSVAQDARRPFCGRFRGVPLFPKKGRASFCSTLNCCEPGHPSRCSAARAPVFSDDCTCRGFSVRSRSLIRASARLLGNRARMEPWNGRMNANAALWPESAIAQA